MFLFLYLHNSLHKLTNVIYNKVVKNKTEIKRIGIDVPNDLWLKVRAQALLKGQPLAEWVAEALKKHLNGNG